MAVSETVLQMVKDNLHITYALDNSTQRRLENEITDGIAYIRKRSDPAATCEPGTQYAGLLCEYVLRAESGARETFEVDYASELRSGQIETAVADYAAAMRYENNA